MILQTLEYKLEMGNFSEMTSKIPLMEMTSKSLIF